MIARQTIMVDRGLLGELTPLLDVVRDNPEHPHLIVTRSSLTDLIASIEDRSSVRVMLLANLAGLGGERPCLTRCADGDGSCACVGDPK